MIQAIAARRADRARTWLAPLALGGAASLGQVPFGLWPLTLLALAGILHLGLTAPTTRAALIRGWMAGFGYLLVGLHWLVEPFMVDAARDGWMAPFALVLLSGSLALYWGVAFLAARFGVFALAAAVTAAEYARGLLFTGFPWGLPGHVWIDTPVAQLARLAGPHGLTLLTLFLAALPLALPRHLPRYAPPLVAALAVAAVYGASALWSSATPAPRAGADAPLVRIVQPNAPQDEKWQPGKADLFFRRALDLTAEDAARPDLVVWPETSVPYFYEYAPEALEQVADAAGGAPAVVGIQRYENPRYFNSMILVGPDGAAQSIYDKAHLVPWGEYVPFADLLGRFGIHGLAAQDGGGYTPGEAGDQIVIPGIGNALPLICYEGIFAAEINAADPRPRLLLLITNDAWFGEFAGPQQHFAQARLRAIEQGLPMVRAANTGISGLIDARGGVLETIPLGVAEARDVALPPAAAPTLYTIVGDWLALGVIAATLLLGLLRRRRWRLDPADAAA
ncbi:Nitrilase/cyanide hydratase and apolipoprotein N-acyltransferase [Oceanicola granulosus HTCC2516]|uniref:Apolipoprotein N-acyltransferase n=1 Tax=Oceanicola granulosus (strain ATCC BAA-861 / DSM 15982 / KCTC 12143 / HTCC2516) TaxID=314256 RepID=Q2CE44_OCEGH|nr:apolipoprotein N-acyltransferase [Oceanicola granulosus]EAR50894.1 Nitrilase/cyanide hydratase and apolipoprotein N-acyltransferase [Oceanicola granulosus HTCC2516]